MKKRKKPFFNENHPELQEGEMFLTNIIPDHRILMISAEGRLFVPSQNSWESIGWESKRLGDAAYDIYGNPIENYRPVFIKKWEHEEACARRKADAKRNWPPRQCFLKVWLVRRRLKQRSSK
jgi:hypothetical protein